MAYSGNSYARVPEARRRRRLRQVSSTTNYQNDLQKYQNNSAVMGTIEEVMQLLKDRKDATLASKHNAHDLDGKFKGFRSCHLYPGGRGDRDIVIIYKFHNREKSCVLHRIGSHKYVYKP